MRFLFLLLAMGYTSFFHAQEKSYHFTNYSISDGLPTSFITELYQDRTGFIWIGTNNGLSRFDGHEFRNFFFNPHDSNSISGNRIYKLTEDKNGWLWIATNHGISVYNPNSGSFKTFVNVANDTNSLPNNLVYDIYIDFKGRIWIGTEEGFCQYDTDKENFIRIENPDNNFSSELRNRISNIAEDKDGQIWVVPQSEGIYKFDPANNKFTHVIIEGKNYKKNLHQNSKIIYIDNDNIFWVGTRGNGFFRYYPSIHKTDWFPTQPGKLNNNHVTEFGDLSEDELWIGTDGGGVNIMNKKSGKFRYIMTNKLISNGLKSNTAQYFIKDVQNNIWIGTVTSGVFVYCPYQNVFEQYRWIPDQDLDISKNVVLEVFEEKNGLIWIGTDGGGLYSFNRKKNEYHSFIHDPSDPASISSNVICSIHEDRFQNLWVGTFVGGLCVKEKNSDKWKRFLPDENNPKSLSSENIWDILEDKKGNLWIATLGGGLNRYNYKEKNFTRFVYSKTNRNSVPSDVINDLTEDLNGKIWIASDKGLTIFDPVNTKFSKVPLIQNSKFEYDETHCTFADSKGNIWAGASWGALFKIDPNSLKTNFYDVSNKNLSNIILSISEDNSGYLWISSVYNLIRFNPENGDTKYFDEKDGLPTKLFTQTSSRLLSTGNMAVGSNDGFIIFDPEDVKTYPYPPLVLLTDLKVANKIILPGEKVNDRIILAKQLQITDKITLTYSEHEFAINFSALQFVNQGKIKVLYKLEGYNEEWREADLKAQSIAYTYLPANTYKFIIKAENGDGIWSNPKSLTIEVLPPYWQTTWFRILLAVIILSFFGFIMYLRTKRLQTRKQDLEKQVSQRTRELAEANYILEERQIEVLHQNEELFQLNHALADQKKEIEQQNQKLDSHRHELESTVDQRTHELQQALNKALEAEKLKSAFLANMSHEIRTPMNAILGFSGLLENVVANPKKQKEYIEIIQSSGNTLLVLIDDIIDFSKIEAGILEFYSADFNIPDLLNELLVNFKLQNTKKDVTISLDLDCNAHEVVFSDKIRTQQILTNFLSNALKFTNKGEIVIGCRTDEDGNLILYVKDTGVGIPEGKYDFIFQPFNKLEDNTEILYRGAGLGLAISNHLAEKMHYTIGVDSTVGVGSNFYIKIPKKLRKKHFIKKTSKTTTSSTNQLLNKRILVAEDEDHNYFFIKELLTIYGFRILWAKNGKECIDIITKDPSIDLVLMDIKMPVMDGIEANRILRAMGFAHPVIALSAYASPTDHERFMEEKFSSSLVKPINSTVLLTEIQRCINLTLDHF